MMSILKASEAIDFDLIVMYVRLDAVNLASHNITYSGARRIKSRVLAARYDRDFVSDLHPMSYLYSDAIR